MSEAGSNLNTFTNQISPQVIEASEGRLRSDIEDNSSQVVVPVMPDRETISGHVVDIDNWASTLTKILEDVPQHMCIPGHPGRICRIPENLREVDVTAYEPYILSIGPYHHGKPQVRQMERRKLAVLKYFLQHLPELTLADYLKEINSIEPEARSFYSDIEMDRENFVRMLLLDSLYVLTMVCGMANSRQNMIVTNVIGSVAGNKETGKASQLAQDIETKFSNHNMQTEMADELNDEAISGEVEVPRWSWTLIEHDLFLLENQLPLFVLQKIFALAYGGNETQLIIFIKDKIGLFLSDYIKMDSETVRMPPIKQVHHLLHVCHLFFRPTIQQDSNSCEISELNQMFRLGSAKQLYKSGIIFEARTCSTKHNLLDITLDKSGKLVMPPCLPVDDNTISLLRNLIALEQMKYPSMGLHVSAYAVLLLQIVTTSKDVELLRNKGIIQHHLASDKEMVHLINRLSVGMAFDYMEDDYSLKVVFRELKKYSEHRMPRWKAGLKHRHCSNPWTAISLLAASFLLLLSLIQTYYTVYSYYHPYLDGHL